MAKYVGYKRPKDTKKTLKHLFAYLGMHKWAFLSVAVLVFISAGANIMGTYLIKPVVNKFITPGDMHGLFKAVAGMGIMYLCGAMANLFDKGFLHNIYFFACMNQDQRADVMGKEVFEKFISGKAGIHMGGNVAAQRILEFTGMPFGEQTRSEKPGIGLIASTDGHKYHRIVIPLVKGSTVL